MAAGVEDTEELGAALTTDWEAALVSDRDVSSTRPGDQADNRLPAKRPDQALAVPEKHEDGVLLEAKDDRWHWRRKIRANPRKLVFYRFAVGFAGLLFIVLGLVTGPIPGPGGIPLVLLGLAIWSSEFEWAQRLMHWFKERLTQFRGWNRWQQTFFWVAFFSVCGLCGYISMLVFGVPTWVPGPAESLLDRLPGL